MADYNVTVSLGGVAPTTGVYLVTAYGADPTGVADSTTAIQTAIDVAYAAGGGDVLLSRGTYKITATITIKDNVALLGAGGQRATTLTKALNGDLVDMHSLARIENVNLECAGATYSGRGIYVSTGYSHQIENVRINQSGGVSLEFAYNNGGGAYINDLEASVNTPDRLVVPAIKFTDNTASPKFFTNIWLPGGLFDFAGGGNGSSLSNFYITNFVTSSSSGLMHVCNGRVASVLDTTYLSGGDIEIVNVAFSGPVEFVNAQGYMVTNCTFGHGMTEDAATCSYNQISDQRKTYTPVWDQYTGTQPYIGNGTITGGYSRNGYTCTVSVRVAFGSSTTFGNSGDAYRISLPFRGHASQDQRGIPVSVICGGVAYTVLGDIGANDSKMWLRYLNASVRLGWPTTWVATDSMDITFTYMVK